MSDLGSFSIRVVDEDGNGVEDVTVTCDYQLGGQGTEYTDSDGWVTFPILKGFTASSYGINTVYINGEEVKDFFYPEDEDTFSFTLSS